MGEQQENDHGSVATLPDAVQAEVIRLIRIIDREAPGGYGAHALRIVRDAVPALDVTTARWREWVGAGRSRVAAELEENERRQHRAARQREILELLEAVGSTAGAWRPYLGAVFDQHGWYVESYASGNAHILAAAELQGTDIEPVLAALRARVPQGGIPRGEDEASDEDEDCAHDDRSCRWCDSATVCPPDRWGGSSCETSCPHCELCQESHDCSRCGASGDCDHEWSCPDCNQLLTRTRDGWEVAE